MAIPAYAKARIAYLWSRYGSIPREVYFDSRKESAPPRYEDSLEAKVLISEVVSINDSYLCKPKSKPVNICGEITRSKKEVIESAIKQSEEASARLASWLADKKEKEDRV